ncbi:diaminopropionate ammonia-lyase [Pseudooceanicola sediminis]|uniref:Diaminopropionate ammonia-lyase n=1 Tax=Pseudooceanicola sediminis TaxID=2211117 RepID=A0A399J4H4_9RHOB|nr:diaminopropionate ammonia-lyase [Pseudooceanicola sediminis]KAA2314728.1 diaminopropionate ammonia-lyase [Puniceibacterium sp. HSS470]RII39319.1 diaminopropionate ammonia-lyase [Pseudooceanicola sediminis]|tara:strand:+ start:165604 stop:166719 length:1116 start_codon:yes stop_codon:yes gene_type:complete
MPNPDTPKPDTPHPDVATTGPRPGGRAQTGTRRGFRVSPARPLAMLGNCPAYAATPLGENPTLSALGHARVLVKDETARMRLGSFKALGGTYAIAQMIADASGDSDLMSDTARAAAAQMTFITASAGNHGLSVAAGARILGAHAVIVLDSTVPAGFATRIAAMGAEVLRVPGGYEDAVAHAMTTADAQGWLLLADGSWPGYLDRPALIMEGYTVLAEECRQQFATTGDWPSHVFLQAGVGGLAAAVAGHIRALWDVQPVITVVEPDRAPCLRISVAAGRPVTATGARSNMGRLDCKDASLLAFDALRHDADHFVTITDAQADAAVTQFARAGLQTTPSGAASLAGMLAADLPADLPAGAIALVIATEGTGG